MSYQQDIFGNTFYWRALYICVCVHMQVWQVQRVSYCVYSVHPTTHSVTCNEMKTPWRLQLLGVRTSRSDDKLKCSQCSRD